MRKIFFICMFFCSFLMLSESVSAVGSYPYIEFNLPTEMGGEELSDLNYGLENIGITYGIDALAFFIETTDGEGLINYARRIHNAGVTKGIYQKEAIVLVYSRDEKKWAIYTTEERALNLFSGEDKAALWSAFLEGEGDYNSIKIYIDALAKHFQAKGTKPIPTERQLPRLVDEADLFTPEEEAEFLARLDELSERQQCDVIIVTVESINGQDPMAFADDFYDYNGYGYGEGDDGILYLLSMEYRDQAYSTYGFGITAFTDAGQAYIFELMKVDLKNDRWKDAFEKYIPLCDEFLSVARNDDPMDIHNLPETPADKVDKFLIKALVAVLSYGISAAVAVGYVMKYEHGIYGGIHEKKFVGSYVVKNSRHIRRFDESLIDKNVYKTRKAYSPSTSSSSSSSRGSSTHTSSSGRSHGGSKNKF